MGRSNGAGSSLGCAFFSHTFFFYNFGLSFTLTMLSRLQTMELLSCCFLSFAVEMDSLAGTKNLSIFFIKNIFLIHISMKNQIFWFTTSRIFGNSRNLRSIWVFWQRQKLSKWPTNQAYGTKLVPKSKYSNIYTYWVLLSRMIVFIIRIAIRWVRL